jgi:hypothetical protein
MCSYWTVECFAFRGQYVFRQNGTRATSAGLSYRHWERYCPKTSRVSSCRTAKKRPLVQNVVLLAALAEVHDFRGRCLGRAGVSETAAHTSFHQDPLGFAATITHGVDGVASKTLGFYESWYKGQKQCSKEKNLHGQPVNESLFIFVVWRFFFFYEVCFCY